MKHPIAHLTALLAAGSLLLPAKAQTPSDKLADLSQVPQLHETKEQRDARMEWFRDGKFGMFIHWGPCSVGKSEIGWGRKAKRPWDIGNAPAGRSEDPVYDNLYKEFNPVKYDPDAWAKFAKESGMTYMVLVAKHHDGFSMYDSKLTDYDIMASPYGKDIVKPFVEACHKYGLKAGIYYSTRDWYHPDYLVGDNAKYDAFYRGQIEELLTNYGKVDMIWFDHVGGQDWGKWRMDELFSMMYRLQPGMLVNDRAAKFIGAKTPEDRPPATPDIKKMTDGDFYTPEGVIGGMDIARDWESCIHVGKQWSYGGEDGFKGPEDCIKMLVSCTTGGGNLLLNFGPRPDGTFTDGEASVARAMGEWLKKYGEAIYGTRGGPYKNGTWGGSCHKGNKLFLHVYKWPEKGVLAFDPLPYKVLSVRTLTGAPVTFTQGATELTIDVAPKDRDTPVTVIELTLDQPVPVGTIVGENRSVPENMMAEYGGVISENATLEISSANPANAGKENYERLFKGEPLGYAFHTQNEKNPWAKVDLGAVKNVKAVAIENRQGDQRSKGLILSVSEDGKEWTQVWQDKEWNNKWFIPVTRFHSGINVLGRPVRYLKLELQGNSQRPLLLRRVTVYGDEKPLETNQ
jgi:alpha-L-fucosidase